MLQPILRWTVGNLSKDGLDCFRFSVKSLYHLYGKSFEYYCCHNNTQLEKLDFLKAYPVKLVDQNKHTNSLSIPPLNNNPSWKLYPPRLDINRPEIFLDNDLIFYKKIPILDDFILGKNSFFITQAIKRSLGCFDKLVQSDINLNSGFFGIPAHFDFQQEIENALQIHNFSWKNHLDEQGCVAFIFHQRKFELIALDQIYICHNALPYKTGKYGQHFVGINKGYTKHWTIFKKSFLF
jgi:hypothetical protein